jgi:L-glyceraldehyde 3-phosphate reductase
VQPLKRVPPAPRSVTRERDRLSWIQFTADEKRYDQMPYRRCGTSGLKLPAISLGAWETFGGYVGQDVARDCIFTAFNAGITCFDLANNYGKPPGRAETVVGRVLRELPREEIIVATKAGFDMWPGPYGRGCSRKSLLTSIDQSLQRLELDHVDIFYAHRFDGETPLEETLGALDDIVQSGKAIYAGVSNYSGAELENAVRITRERRCAPLIVQQSSYSMLRRDIESDLLPVARKVGVGVIAFSPLAHGLLSSRYVTGVPEQSRAAQTWTPEQRANITPAVQVKIAKLNDVATARGQTLPQMAIAWILRCPEIASVLIGASTAEQILENVKALEKSTFNDDEFRRIDEILAAP